MWSDQEVAVGRRYVLECRRPSHGRVLWGGWWDWFSKCWYPYGKWSNIYRMFVTPFRPFQNRHLNRNFPSTTFTEEEPTITYAHLPWSNDWLLLQLIIVAYKWPLLPIFISRPVSRVPCCLLARLRGIQGTRCDPSQASASPRLLSIPGICCHRRHPPSSTHFALITSLLLTFPAIESQSNCPTTWKKRVNKLAFSFGEKTVHQFRPWRPCPWGDPHQWARPPTYKIL